MPHSIYSKKKKFFHLRSLDQAPPVSKIIKKHIKIKNTKYVADPKYRKIQLLFVDFKWPKTRGRKKMQQGKINARIRIFN